MLAKSASLCILAGLVTAAPARRWPWGSFIGANFWMTNGFEGNQLVTSYILPDGTLSAGSAVWTGGNGSASMNPMSTGNHPDPFLGGGSVMVLGSQVFAVNAGSNTFSVFDIDTKDPGTPTWNACYPSNGDFPQSLAASPNGQIVCVLNGGSMNGFSCYNQGQSGWKHNPNWDRTFGLNLTTPPHGPVGGTPSQLAFAADYSAIIVAVKGQLPTDLNNPTGKFQDGAIYWYPIGEDGTLAQTPTIVTAAAPFSIVEDWQNPGVFFFSDVTTGYAVWDCKSNATAVKQGTLEGQMAACWSAQDPRTGNFFVQDAAGNATTFEVSINPLTLNGTVVGQSDIGVNVTATDVSVFEANARDYLYINAVTDNSANVYKIGNAMGQWELIQQYTPDMWPHGTVQTGGFAGQANWYAEF